MRNFEEIKNEILRRSYERINKRKVVKRCILGIAIPLFICVVSLSVLLNVAPVSKKLGNEDYTDVSSESYISNGEFNNAETENNFSYVEDYFNLYTVELNISDNKGAVKNYTADNDNDRIIKITNIIDCAFLNMPSMEIGTNAAESSTDATAAPDNNDTPTKEENKSPSIKYTIEVIGSDGESVIFTLEDYRLTNAKTGDTATLTNYEYNSLLYNFGFEEEK